MYELFLVQGKIRTRGRSDLATGCSLPILDLRYKEFAQSESEWDPYLFNSGSIVSSLHLHHLIAL